MNTFSRACLLFAAVSLCASAWSDTNDRQELFERYLDFASLVQDASVEPNWLADGTSFWYAQGGPVNRVVWKVDAVAGVREALFDVPRLRSAIADALGYQPSYTGVPFERFQLSPDGTTASFALDGRSFSLDMATYEISALSLSPPTQATAVTPGTYGRQGYFGAPTPVPDVMSPDGRWLAKLVDRNIALVSTTDGSVRQLTSDGTEDDAWDLESMRMLLTAGIRVEFVPFTPWSPDSLKLWATRMERTDMPRIPEAHYLETIVGVDMRPFAIAGGKIDHARPQIVNVLSGEVLGVDTPTKDFYFNQLAWLPDSSEVLFARYTRDFKTVDILAASATDGSVRGLFSESTDTFVKIQHDILSSGISGFTLLPEGQRFIWESTRDGWNHLYLYDLEGRLQRQLTRGDFPVLDVTKVDHENGWVYFAAHGESPRVYDTHLYRVSLSGGEMQRLTHGEGQHQVQFSPGLEYFLDTISAPNQPPRTELRGVDGELILTLGEADISQLETLGWTPSQEFTVKAADGETDLWGVMHFPFDFDPEKKYPVLEYLYAGPQIVTADRSFALGQWKSQNLPRAMAQLGYVVVTLDARGTPERSKAFHDVVYRNWGRHEIADHAAAIRQLAERHAFMDLDRVGVWGHSWGGYFAFDALAKAPDLYRAAVSSAPGFDPYRSLLYEPYLDMPNRAKAAYDFASPFRHAPTIKGKLMLVGGTADFATFPEYMKMSHALIEAGVDHEQVVLPEQGHGYSGNGEDYYIRKLVDFFDRNVMRR